MKTPLDCQLLKLGMDFVRFAKFNDLPKCFELIGADDGSDNDGCRSKAGILVGCENYRSLTENLSSIHALVDDVKVRLEFHKNERENVCLTLICFAVPGTDGGEIKIKVREISLGSSSVIMFRRGCGPTLVKTRLRVPM